MHTANRLNSIKDKLKSSQEKIFSSILSGLENSNLLVSIKNLEGIYLGCNKKYADFLGIEQEEIIGKSAYFLYGRNSADSITKSDSELIRTGQQVTSTILLTKKSINEFLRTNKSLITDENGNNIGILTISEVVTDYFRNVEVIRDLLKTLKKGLVIIDEGKITLVNKYLLKVLQFNSEELLGKEYLDLLSDRGIELLNSSKNDFICSIEENFRTYFRKKNGGDLNVEVSVKRINLDNRVSTYLIVTNLEENDDYQFELKEGAVFFEKNPYPVLRVDTMGKIIKANTAAKQIFNSNLKDEQINLYLPEFSQINKEVLQKEQFTQMECDTKRRNFLFTVKYDEETKSFYLYGTDITQRKLDERKIRLQNKIMETAANGIVITEADGTIIWVNPAVTKLTGYKPKELIGKKPNIFKSGKHNRVFYKKLWDTITKGEVWKGTIINKKKDGSLYHEETTLTPVKNNLGLITHYIAIKQDITQFVEDQEKLRKHKEELERKVYERTKELQLAKERAEKSDQLKSEFLAQISHEIRTPVNAMFGFSSILEMYLEDNKNEDIEFAFEMIRNGGQRLIRTVDLIINMSELQLGTYSAKFEQINVSKEIIEPLIKEYKSAAEKEKLTLTFTNKLNEDDFVVIDKYSVWQTISNIIDNGIKYTKIGGVEIIAFRNNKNKVEVNIKDTGIGISEEYLPKIFEPFSQEESGYTRKYEGNGLGMTLVYEYCKLNKITLDIDSKKNVGSNFKLIFEK